MEPKDIIKLAQLIGELKRIKRSGWLLQGKRDVESVADHVFRVAFLTMVLSQDTKLNRDRMIKMALVHDSGEALVGDIVHEMGTKVVGNLKTKTRDERRAINEIFSNLPGKQEYVQLWEEWATQKTPEAKFIKRVEKLEMAMQALEYEKQGYRLGLFYENTKQYLKGSTLEPIFKELLKQRQEMLHRKKK